MYLSNHEERPSFDRLRTSGTPIPLSLRSRHLRDAAHAGVAGIQVVLLVHRPVAGLDELPVADAHAVSDGAEHVAVPIQFQKLAVLTAGHPWLSVRIEIQRAHEIPHLHRLEKLALSRIDDDAVFLAVADPDVAIGRIDGESVRRAELPLPYFVAIPLVDELAVLVETNDPRRPEVVGRII